MIRDKIADKIRVNTGSIYQFFELLKKDQWKEEDLDQFVSTPGIKFLIRQERDTDGNNSEEAVKTFLKMVKEGESGKLGGWATSYHERVRTKRRLAQLFQRWGYLMDDPSKIVLSYFPEELEPKGEFYLLPGGLRESYADCAGFGINLGCDNTMKTDKEMQFHLARQEYRYLLCETSGHDFGISECRTPEDYLREFLRIVMREGMGRYLGLKAQGDKSEFFERHVMADESWKKSVEKAFQVLMDSRTRIRAHKKGKSLKKEVEKLEKVAKRLEREVFTGEYSPAAMVGLSIARVIDPERIDTSNETRFEYLSEESELADLSPSSDTRSVRDAYKEDLKRRKESLWDAVKGASHEDGFTVFFELGRLNQRDTMVPPVMWDAFSAVRKTENIFLGGGFP
ncbi:MAG: hypothetical protein HXS40_06830 [Theionarchaea archaeon]|nr:hypothetical protein [Theionarchaea archaeon]